MTGLGQRRGVGNPAAQLLPVRWSGQGWGMGGGGWKKGGRGEGFLRTLLSSFWYWGIFFSIWDRSRMVVCGEGSTVSLDLMEPCEAGGHVTGQQPL